MDKALTGVGHHAEILGVGIWLANSTIREVHSSGNELLWPQRGGT